MITRMKFRLGEQRKFLTTIELTNGISPELMAKIGKVTIRRYGDWKREKYCMDSKAIREYCQQFKTCLPEREEILVDRWIQHKREGSKRGGHARYLKFGLLGTLESRRKGGSKSIHILQAQGKMNPAKDFKYPRYSSKLAEFIGIMLGDGCINPGMIDITLNSEADKKYIPHVVDLCDQLFGEKAKVMYRPKAGKVARIYMNGVNLVKYLQKIGLKIGNKVRQQVGVPAWILKNQKYQVSCVRGLMETDGGIFWHRYKVNGKMYAYRKLAFANSSIPLLEFVRDVFIKFGFHPRIVLNKHVWLYNTQEVASYKKIVGVHNPRLLK